MLKQKLRSQKCSEMVVSYGPDSYVLGKSRFFEDELFERFWILEMELNQKLMKMSKPLGIEYIYNPLQYANILHCNYLKKYLTGVKKVVFIGLNPGPNGMGQTGIPFGNVNVVENLMQLKGGVLQPCKIHPKRPINGLMHGIEEPSGKRLWSLFQQLAGSLDTFFQQCFVHNFCPLIFYDNQGKNITPSELKGLYKNELRDECLKTLELILNILESEIIVAIGDYVYKCLKRSDCFNKIRVIKLVHPSLRVVGNQNWPEKAEKFLFDENIIRFMRNEI